jgi:hypothetical protein
VNGGAGGAGESFGVYPVGPGGGGGGGGYPSPYTTESLLRFAVDKEKSGFDQCRNRLIGWLDKRLEDLPQTSPPSEDYYVMDYLAGKEAAFQDVLEYLKGVGREQHQQPSV